MSLPISELIVICVDDEPDVLQTFSEAIEETGFKPICVSSGQEALESIASSHRHLAMVVSDFRMPGMDGLQLRAKMLPQHAQVPFALVSGYVSREEALSSAELKISAFLEKPFKQETLAQLIRSQTKDRAAQLRDEAELISGFIADAENLVEEMESLLLALEAHPSDIDTVNRIFAVAHTIKGASGFFQPKTIHRFTHAYEDFLSPYKKNAQAVPPAAVSVLFRGLDVIKSLLPPLRDGKPDPAPLEDLLQVLRIAPEDSSSGSSERMPDLPAKTVQGPAPKDEVKVPVAMLDEFMELSGEITVIRNMINKQVRAIEKDSSGNKSVSLLSELLNEMHKINGQMQDKITDLRKVGCKHIFRPLKRAVRDLSGTLKKDVDLKLDGEDVRVDTSIAEILSNSLIHMVRNCMDHGLETPAVRADAGKGTAGSISITAREHNNEVVVTISDDGRGIDPEAIRRKLVEKKLCSQEKAAAMSAKELLPVIFDSGFSTASQVTDVSGRGVGMDMVKKAVTGGGGRIEIESTPGIGTTFQLLIPVPKAVSIISSLLVKVGEHLLAIPQENLLRLISVPEAARSGMIRCQYGADFLFVGSELYPVVNLEAILAGARAHQFIAPARQLQFALVCCDQGEFAIVVSDIFDVEDTVVKKLGADLRGLSLFRGATFLGDGMVGLILDISGIARYARISRHCQSAVVPGDKPSASGSRAALRSLLLLEINAPGIYGVYLDEIFRLENFETASLQESGGTSALIYRGQTCPVASVDDLLGFAHSLDSVTADHFSALVFSAAGKFTAVKVKRILDLVLAENSVDASFVDRRGVLGKLLYGERTVTILNGSGLVELQRSREFENEKGDLACIGEPVGA